MCYVLYKRKRIMKRHLRKMCNTKGGDEVALRLHPRRQPERKDNVLATTLRDRTQEQGTPAEATLREI